MNRETFRAFYSACRKAKHSREILHNGRRWIVTRGDCQRLDAAGCYDRVGRVAAALSHATDCRRRLNLPRATRGILGIARAFRIEDVT